MKILKKMLKLVSIAAMIIACEDTKVEPIGTGNQNPVISNAPHYLEANLEVEKVSGFPIDQPPVNLSVSYRGNGTSNLMSRVALEASHTEEFATVFEDGDFLVKDGQFVIRSEDGDQIFGTYNGYGSHTLTNFYVSWSLQIQGGTGSFIGARGSLSVRFTPSSRTTSSSQGPWHAEISGTIKVDQSS